jgi:hypothetical protein
VDPVVNLTRFGSAEEVTNKGKNRLTLGGALGGLSKMHQRRLQTMRQREITKK